MCQNIRCDGFFYEFMGWKLNRTRIFLFFLVLRAALLSSCQPFKLNRGKSILFLMGPTIIKSEGTNVGAFQAKIAPRDGNGSKPIGFSRPKPKPMKNI